MYCGRVTKKLRMWQPARPSCVVELLLVPIAVCLLCLLWPRLTWDERKCSLAQVIDHAVPAATARMAQFEDEDPQFALQQW